MNFELNKKHIPFDYKVNDYWTYLNLSWFYSLMLQQENFFIRWEKDNVCDLKICNWKNRFCFGINWTYKIIGLILINSEFSSPIS